MKKLFLDDLRNPSDIYGIGLTKNWDIVRTYSEAVDYVLKNGIPNIISFDHDLGENESGYDFAKWLVYKAVDFEPLPKDFMFFVHSANFIGGDNIINLIYGYLIHKRPDIKIFAQKETFYKIINEGNIIK